MSYFFPQNHMWSPHFSLLATYKDTMHNACSANPIWESHLHFLKNNLHKFCATLRSIKKDIPHSTNLDAQRNQQEQLTFFSASCNQSSHRSMGNDIIEKVGFHTICNVNKTYIIHYLTSSTEKLTHV